MLILLLAYAGFAFAAVNINSATQEMLEALDGIERGATDCLRKPVEPVEAVVRTRAALRVWELQHSVREGNKRLTELEAQRTVIT